MERAGVVSLLRIVSSDDIAAYLHQNLAALGFRMREGLISHDALDKDDVRSLHAKHRADSLAKIRDRVYAALPDIAPFFCDGSSIDPLKIEAFIRPVLSEIDARLFDAATMLWSVPVSQGYGRRNRFLVCDRQNGALIGIFAVGDPVFNLTPRDRLIGWSADDRKARLYRVFDAFVMGAVPPYRELLGGKLVALAAISNETRRFLKRKYSGRKTKITKEIKSSAPVLVTTTSSLGRSSIYNRIRLGSRTLYYSVGYTKGFGHFHIPDQLFAAMVEYLRSRAELPGNRYGMGPNWRMRVIRRALHRLGLNPELVRHGVQREVFLAPLAHNWREVLRGEEKVDDPIDLPLADLSSFFVSRWAVPRALRDPRYKAVTALQTIDLIAPGYSLPTPMLDARFLREEAHS